MTTSERRREKRAERARKDAEQHAQRASADKPPPKQAQEPKEPSTSPGLVGAVVRWVVKWVWFDKSQLVTGIFRGLAVLGVGYLLYDRLYETALTVSAAASDPKDAFKYPFSINNNSHLFSVSGLQWRCLIISIKSEHLNMTNGVIGFGTNSSIQAGQNLNITCDPSTMIRSEQRPEFTTAIIQIALSHAVHILWYNLHVAPNPTPFTWIGTASNPQWVRGYYAR
jgi:hypothetical protein